MLGDEITFLFLLTDVCLIAWICFLEGFILGITQERYEIKMKYLWQNKNNKK